LQARLVAILLSGGVEACMSWLWALPGWGKADLAGIGGFGLRCVRGNCRFPSSRGGMDRRRKAKENRQSLAGLAVFVVGAVERAAAGYFMRVSSETVSFLRPFARRAASTLRPLAVAILWRKPCLLILLRREGWNVLFILRMFLFYLFIICGVQM